MSRMTILCPARGGRKTSPIEVDEEYLPPIIKPIIRGATKEQEERKVVTRSTSSRLSFVPETEVTVPTVGPAVRGVPAPGVIWVLIKPLKTSY
jgi:hypothetical protein